MAKINKQERDKIREALRLYAAKYPSQNKAAASLKGVSAATVSAILNGKDDMVSTAMWRQIATQIGLVEDEWNIVETGSYLEITTAMADAQAMRSVMWIVGDAGCGKTTAAKSYAKSSKGVYYILCAEDMNRGDFVKEVGRVCGVKTDGFSIREMWQFILDQLVQLESPLLIFDEADKLKDLVFSYFVSMYNKLEDKAGIIFLSTAHIEKRVRRGLQWDKRGYKEFFSRIGRKFYELDPATSADVAMVCRANGVTEDEEIAKVVQEAGIASDSWKPSGAMDGIVNEYDFRRVKKSVRRTVLMRDYV
jgi:DNA transposition AAA+ family ATPase